MIGAARDVISLRLDLAGLEDKAEDGGDYRFFQNINVVYTWRLW